jgi:hypothetical protein
MYDNQQAVKNNPKLLEWVLRNDYLVKNGNALIRLPALKPPFFNEPIFFFPVS